MIFLHTHASNFSLIVYASLFRVPLILVIILAMISHNLMANAASGLVCSVGAAWPIAGPIKTKLGIGTHVDQGSVLVKVKVKVMWCHLANANKTPYRGPGPD